MVGQYSVVATGRAGAGLMVATLVLVNVGWSAMRGGFRVRVGGTTVWGQTTDGGHRAHRQPPGEPLRPQTGSLQVGTPLVDSDERRVVDGLRQVSRGTDLPSATRALLGRNACPACALHRRPKSN